MSFVTTMVFGFEGVSTEYHPGFTHDGMTIAGTVHVSLVGAERSTHLSLSVEDARSLLAQLPGVLAEHDRGAAEVVSVYERDAASSAEWWEDPQLVADVSTAHMQVLALPDTDVVGLYASMSWFEPDSSAMYWPSHGKAA